MQRMEEAAPAFGRLQRTRTTGLIVAGRKSRSPVHLCLPGTADAPFSEIVVGGRPSTRKIVGKHAPLAAAPQDVEDSV